MKTKKSNFKDWWRYLSVGGIKKLTGNKNHREKEKEPKFLKNKVLDICKEVEKYSDEIVFVDLNIEFESLNDTISIRYLFLIIANDDIYR